MERLRGHEQANAYIQREGTKINLISYRTKVLEFDVIERTVYCTGLYSVTTRKHIGWFANQFLSQYGINYHDIKQAYNNNTSLLVIKEVF